MTETIIFVLGLVVGLTTNVFLQDRGIEQAKQNKIDMRKAIEKDLKNGYQPDIAKYKKKFHIK